MVPSTFRYSRASEAISAWANSDGVRGWMRPASSRAPQRVRVALHLTLVDLRVVRAVHRHQRVAADELPELQQVDVARPADERTVHEDEPMIGVAVERRQVDR